MQFLLLRVPPNGFHDCRSTNTLANDFYYSIALVKRNLMTVMRSLKQTLLCIAFLIIFTGPTSAVQTEPEWISDVYRRGDFKLAERTRVADIVVSAEDFKVVQIAAENLAADVQRVTGKKPLIRSDSNGLSGYVVFAGTLGKSSFIDSLVSQGKLDVTQLRGQWESFLIATVTDPVPGVSMGLAIVGSDRRGTAFGIFELSEAIGVSPWYWWADVTPRHRDSLFVQARTYRAGPPSVQYRGIFLNDEDLGLQPWAAKTFDPQLGDIGPKTYARVFELLLRLKANTLWPAMHGCTKAFNLYTDNKRVADDYAIVMGSSHAEPMLRNNVTEWSEKHENYDYTQNADGVRHYWEQRVEQNGKFENVYTIGMRGIHDSPIQGPKTQAERIRVLEQIFADQRGLLAKHVKKDVSTVPQIFCPYKEVLSDYRNGLKVPEDVTIVFPDDNFGYIRYLPTDAERKRRGGFGVYYHVSYLGGPLSYLWLDTTPPSLIWEEMSKAYEHGVRKLWMLNVGDIKPAEISIELFMQMGWDISKWHRNNLNDFLVEWAASKFGARYATESAAIMGQYYQLGFTRKPEHLQWNFANEDRKPTALTAFDYGDEIQQRIDAYELLRERADRLNNEIPPSLRDAFYEMVVYPVRASAFANLRYFSFEKAREYMAQGRASASEWARKGEEATRRLNLETTYFNEKLAGGKWRYMMTEAPAGDMWQYMRMKTPVAPATLQEMKLSDTPGLGVAIEGRREPLKDGDQVTALPLINGLTREMRFIDVFNTGRSPARWKATTGQRWIKLSHSGGDLRYDTRLLVSVDWSRIPKEERFSGKVEVSGAGTRRVITVPVFNPKTTAGMGSFVETGGVVSIEAEHFSQLSGIRSNVMWSVISGLGRTGDAISVSPTTAASIKVEDIPIAPAINYSVHLFTTGKFNVICYLVPTFPITTGQGLRYAVAFDNQPPQIVTVGADLQTPSRQWSLNVLNGSTTGVSNHEIATAGAHTLKIYMVDAGVVLDKIVIDTGGLKPSYLGPPETRSVKH
jgi:Glycosyl hydrolase family 115/Gylcosyl hydrolase family 115 C-terminal domain